MSKLKKQPDIPESDDSITISKYVAFDENQTALPEPVRDNIDTKEQHHDPLSPPKKTKSTAKKTNKSTKKQNALSGDDEEIGKPVSKRKIKVNNKIIFPKPSQKVLETQKENDHSENSLQLIVKKSVGKRQKSELKNKRKTKVQPQLKQPSEDSELSYHRNDQEKPKQVFMDQKSNKEDSIETQSNQSQRSKESINFNRRLKKSKNEKRQQIDAIFSGYAEDESSGSHIRRDVIESHKGRSDLTDYELYNNKKEKKTKKDQGPKVKNKFFKDIQCSTATTKEEESYQGQDPPEDCSDLVIQIKQPRKTFVNFQKIEQKAAHVKDKRQMKIAPNETKFKNEIKSTIREVKYADEVEIAIQNPKLAGTKGASGALHLKNNLEKHQKICKNTQSQSQNETYSPLNLNQKMTQIRSSNLQKAGSTLQERIRKEQQYALKQRKKGVERGQFEKRLAQDMKLKKQTTFTSQEVLSNIRSTSLDDEDFDIDFAEDVLSNCSSRSGSRAKQSRYEKRTSGVSVDSQNSRKSQDSVKSNKSFKNMQEQQIRHPANSVIVEMNDSENSLPSLSLKPNANQINQNSSVNLNSYSEEEFMSTNRQKSKLQEMIEYQKEQDQKLLLKKMKKYEKKLENKQKVEEVTSRQAIDGHLGDNNEEKGPRKKRKNKSKRTKKSSFSIETYFEEQAEFSSSEQGHTDQESNEKIQQDVDIDGNLKDMLDEDTKIVYNEAAVRKKFLQDEAKRQLQEMQRIIKKMRMGKHKTEDTESEKKRKKRMEQAVQRNRLKDLADKQVVLQRKDQNNPTTNEKDIDADNHDESQNRKKIQELEQQLLYGGRRTNDDTDRFIVNQQSNPLDIFNTVIPEPRNHRQSVLQRQFQNTFIQNRPKNPQPKKSLIDIKKNNIEQQIHNKRKTVEKRGSSTGNRNKIQKTSTIQLGIRNISNNQDEDIQI